MKPFWALLPVALVLGGCAERVTVQSGSAERPVVANLDDVKLARHHMVVPTDPSLTFASPDGRFSFAYPATWFIEEAWGLQRTSFLTNFKLGSRCCDMQDGDLKMDFGPEASSKNETVDDLLHAACRSQENMTVHTCRIQRIAEQRWARVESDDMGFTDVYVATVYEGRIYTAIAFIFQGEHYTAGHSAFDRIIASFSLR